MNRKNQNEVDNAAEAVVEIIKTNSTIGIILAIGFAAGCILALIFTVIYAANWVSDTKKTTQQIYAPSPSSDYRVY